MKINQLIFLLFLPTAIYSQHFAIENQHLNLAYPLIDNPLSIVVENEDCQQITAKTDNGFINKPSAGANPCAYNFTPQTIGPATITIYKTTNSDTILIGKRKYRVKKWPPHEARFGRNSEIMGKGEFFANEGIHIPIQFGDMSGEINVVSCQIEVKRKEELIKSLKNNGGRFEAENTAILRRIIQSGDVILFSKIRAVMPGEQYERTFDVVRVEIK